MTKDAAMIESGVYLIAMAGDTISTTHIDQAIEKLQEIKHLRENIPF